MRHLNGHNDISPITIPPAYAEGAAGGVTARARHRQVFIDTTPCDDPESARCRALWRAVIGQQILDAKSPSRATEKLLLKSRALEWLFHNRSDFTMACDLAGWEPDYVHSLCVRAQKLGFHRRITRARKKLPHA